MQALSGRLRPHDLDEARRQFERWRRGRRRGARIPEVLWRAAVGLAGRHGVSKTSQALHLDYYALQRRLSEGRPRRRAGEAAFVEVSLPAAATGARCQIEIGEAGSGTVRVDLAGLSAAELATFVRKVCGRES